MDPRDVITKDVTVGNIRKAKRRFDVPSLRGRMVKAVAGLSSRDAAYAADHTSTGFDMIYEYAWGKAGIGKIEDPDEEQDLYFKLGTAHIENTPVGRLEIRMVEGEVPGYNDPRRSYLPGKTSRRELIKQLNLRRKFELKYYGKTNLSKDITEKSLGRAIRTGSVWNKTSCKLRSWEKKG